MEVDQVADFDERFEFDAPRYYDFEAMDGGGTPCDKWFDSAPDGPGVKPEKGERRNGLAGSSKCCRGCRVDILTRRFAGAVGEREPFKQIQQVSAGVLPSIVVPHSLPSWGVVRHINLQTMPKRYISYLVCNLLLQHVSNSNHIQDLQTIYKCCVLAGAATCSSSSTGTSSTSRGEEEEQYSH